MNGRQLNHLNADDSDDIDHDHLEEVDDDDLSRAEGCPLIPDLHWPIDTISLTSPLFVCLFVCLFEDVDDDAPCRAEG